MQGKLNYLERHVFKDIEDWVNKPRRKPLLLGGARQVGKTWFMLKIHLELYSRYIRTVMS